MLDANCVVMSPMDARSWATFAEIYAFNLCCGGTFQANLFSRREIPLQTPAAVDARHQPHCLPARHYPPAQDAEFSLSRVIQHTNSASTVPVGGALMISDSGQRYHSVAAGHWHLSSRMLQRHPSTSLSLLWTLLMCAVAVVAAAGAATVQPAQMSLGAVVVLQRAVPCFFVVSGGALSTSQLLVVLLALLLLHCTRAVVASSPGDTARTVVQVSVPSSGSNFTRGATRPEQQWHPRSSRLVTQAAAVYLVMLACLLSGSNGAVSAAQKTALTDLYTATNGASWSAACKTNWNTGDPCVNAWAKVTCDTGKTKITYVAVMGSSCRAVLSLGQRLPSCALACA